MPKLLSGLDLIAGSSVGLAPSGDETGVADAAAISAAIAALPASGGIVTLSPAAEWYIECGQISVNRSAVYVNAEGCWINAVGSGDVIRMYDSSDYNDRTVHGGGLLGNPIIDGTGTTAPSCAFHAGDIFRMRADLSPQNFTGTGSIGAHFDNTYYWTERLKANVFATNCTTHVMFDQNPAAPGTPTSTGSFLRGDLTIYVDQDDASYDGIVFANGTYPTGSFLRWWGNFASASSGTLTSAAVKVTGATPAGSADSAVPSNIYECLLNWNFEGDANTAMPYAVWIDEDSNCSAAATAGIANFAPGGSLNFNGFVGSVGFWGISDSIPSQTTQTMLFEGIIAIGSYASPASLATDGEISTSATWAPVAPSAAVTGVTLGSGTQDGQLTAVFNDSAYSITFAASGTSNVATGTSEVIPAGSMRLYAWSVYTGLWYPVGPGTFTAHLTSNVESPTTGTALANVTGLAAYLTVGTWKIRAHLPVQSVSATATAKFAWSFGGTASSALITWLLYGSGYAVPQTSTTLTTEMTTGVTTSATVVYYVEATATVTVSAAGTLQLQCANGTSGDAFNVLAGAFAEFTQIA